MPDQIFDELILSDARGGRKRASKLSMAVERQLTSQDLEVLSEAETPAVAPAQTALTAIRHAHHQLARLLAEGLPQTEISLITGYSPSYISTIKNDPAIAELVQHYTSQREAIFIDTAERMKVLGLSTLDELSRRLEEEPTSFSRRELMEMADLTLLKPQSVAAQRAASAGSASGASISISFVTPPQMSEIPAPSNGKTIEGRVVRKEENE